MTTVIDKTNLRKAQREGWADWIMTDADEQAVRAGCYFDVAAAERVFRFFERVLRHSKGEWGGQAFTLLEWQKRDLLGPLFGWRRADGLRRFRRAHIEIPKKNGKSTLGAGVGLYMLEGDGEPGAEVYSAATKKEQASIVHGEAINMVKASPLLSRRLKINNTTKTIVNEATYSKYSVLASDAGGSEGLNIHCLVADELHVWKGRAFWDSLRYGYAARRQPLAFVITTAGIYDRTTLGWQEHEYAQKILEGKEENPEFFAYIRAADPDDDILDPATHAKANPSYGVTIRPEEMMQAAREAVQKKSEMGPFLRYRLNIWSEQADSFFDMAAWDRCSHPVDEEALRGRRCFGGLDLANRRDVAAWVLLFPPTDEDPLWRVLPRLFVPGETAAKRESEDGVKYATWGREGLMILTDGDSIDNARIVEQVVKDAMVFDIQDVGADPWQLEALAQQVFDHLPDLQIVQVGQNFRDLSEPTKELESLVLSGKLAHGGHDVLRWMAGNCVPIEDGNENIRLSKKRSKEKIDGIAALTTALARAMMSEEAGLIAPSVY